MKHNSDFSCKVNVIFSTLECTSVVMQYRSQVVKKNITGIPVIGTVPLTVLCQTRERCKEDRRGGGRIEEEDKRQRRVRKTIR